jgi:hypothetical protein
MLVLLTIAAAAAAQAPAAAVPPKVDDPVVCVRQHTGDEVGTRIQAKKVCMKKSERDFIEQAEEQAVKHYINNGNDRSRFVPQSSR